MASPTSDSTDVSNNGKCEDESLEFTASGDLFMVKLVSKGQKYSNSFIQHDLSYHILLNLFQDTSLGITPLCGSSKYNSNQHLYVGDFKVSGEKV